MAQPQGLRVGGGAIVAGPYDVVVVGAGNAAFCAALAAREKGASVLMVERAPKELMGGNSRFTAGAFRCVYDGVDDLKAIMPDLTTAEIDRSDFGTYTQDQFYDDMFRVTQLPHRRRPVRPPGRPLARRDALAARQGHEVRSDLGPPGLSDRRQVQVLGRPHGGIQGRRAGPGRPASQARREAGHRDRLRHPRASS